MDFLEAVKGADQDYVKSVFLEHQKFRVCQENIPTEAPAGSSGNNIDEVWEPIRTVLIQETERERTGCHSYLIGRIAQANVRRRQQFAYWAKHRDKLHNHTKASLSTQAPKGGLPNARLPNLGEFPARLAINSATVPSVTTATNINITRLEALDNHSTWTVSEYAPSTWLPAHKAIDYFPPAPKLPWMTLSNEFFECPYCFTLCPRETLADKAWKAHLIHDLRPYICTYEDCRNSSQLYDSRQDWVQHENSAHRMIWRCLEHVNQVFTRVDTYKHHLQSEHAQANDEASLDRIIQASESVSDVADWACPICMVMLDTARAMEGHVALHLERLACFSLPRSVIGDDESNADSDKANGVAEESRDGAFDDDSNEFSNTNGSVNQETEHTPEGGSSSSSPGVGSSKGKIQGVDKELESGSGPINQELQQSTNEEAEKMHREALGLTEKVLGREHPETLASMSNLFPGKKFYTSAWASEDDAPPVSDGGYGPCPLSATPHARYDWCCPKFDPNWSYDQRRDEMRRVVNNVIHHGRRNVSPETLEAHKVANRQRHTPGLTRQYGQDYWVGVFHDDPG